MKSNWVNDVLEIVKKQGSEFSLKDIYSFTDELKEKHPNNAHPEAKIRQSIQVLRNRNLIEFMGNGAYKVKQ